MAFQLHSSKSTTPASAAVQACLEGTEERAQRESAPLEARSPPPNGGWVAWMQVAGSWCLMFNSLGLVNAYGVFQTYYETELLKEHTSSNIAWIGSIQAFLVIFTGALTGPLYDYGYFRYLLATGSFLMVFGMMMVSLCTKYWQFVLAQGVVMGLGGGCLFVPSIAILPTYFSTRMAFSMGVAGSGSGLGKSISLVNSQRTALIVTGTLGGVVYPIAFQQLVRSIGFGWAARIVAFIMLATLAFPLLVMRVRVNPPAIRKLFDASAWSELPWCIFCLGQVFGFIGVYIPLFYVTVDAIEKGIMSSALAFYLLPMLNAGSVVGRIVPNYGADKIGPLNMFAPTCLCLAILSFAWMSIKNAPGLIVFSILYGFFIGAFMTLPFSSIVRLSPNIGVVGVRMGMGCAAVSLGLLIGTPVGGAILRHGGWTALQSFGASALVISAISVVATRVSKAGWRLRTKV